MVWTILGAGTGGGQEGVNPRAAGGRCGTGCRERSVEVGRVQRCGAVPRKEHPHWGRPEKVAATPSPLLGSLQHLPHKAWLSDHRPGSFPSYHPLVQAPRTSRVR